jgi:hypothetical protein
MQVRPESMKCFTKKLPMPQAILPLKREKTTIESKCLTQGQMLQQKTQLLSIATPQLKLNKLGIADTTDMGG